MFYVIKNKNDEEIERFTDEEKADQYLFFVDTEEEPHYKDIVRK